MDTVFAWIEDGALSTYVRSSPSIVFGFPGILVLHTLGMGILAGASIAIDLRLLGVAPGIPVTALRNLLPLLWLALAVNVVSGVLLLIGYPTKALTNPVFYVKMGFIVLALLILNRFRKAAFTPVPDVPAARVKLLAAASLLFWLGAITAGRFLAYTHTRLLVDHEVRF